MSDFYCDLCHAPAGLLVQWEAGILRCSACNAPCPVALMRLVDGDLCSRYRAVLLSRKSEELEVVAEGIGSEILSQVLEATADGKFVWMKPI